MTHEEPTTIRPVNIREMRGSEREAAVEVWREANIARGAPHGPERTSRIRAKLSAPDALPFVALRPKIVGMALAEPGRFDDGAGELDPSLLHISMVFVHPAAQRTGVGLPLLQHVLATAHSLDYQRVGVWTAEENAPARRLYERAGMTLSGKSARVQSGTHLQYEAPLGDVSRDGGAVRPNRLRVTHVYRREDGEWKIVHRHGDGLESERPET